MRCWARCAGSPCSPALCARMTVGGHVPPWRMCARVYVADDDGCGLSKRRSKRRGGECRLRVDCHLLADTIVQHIHTRAHSRLPPPASWRLFPLCPQIWLLPPPPISRRPPRWLSPCVLCPAFVPERRVHARETHGGHQNGSTASPALCPVPCALSLPHRPGRVLLLIFLVAPWREEGVGEAGARHWEREGSGDGRAMTTKSISSSSSSRSASYEESERATPNQIGTDGCDSLCKTTNTALIPSRHSQRRIQLGTRGFCNDV